jgi:hypothetical protein
MYKCAIVPERERLSCVDIYLENSDVVQDTVSIGKAAETRRKSHNTIIVRLETSRRIF